MSSRQFRFSMTTSRKRAAKSSRRSICPANVRAWFLDVDVANPGSYW